jgi:hypothetical protein
MTSKPQSKSRKFPKGRKSPAAVAIKELLRRLGKTNVELDAAKMAVETNENVITELRTNLAHKTDLCNRLGVLVTKLEKQVAERNALIVELALEMHCEQKQR